MPYNSTDGGVAGQAVEDGAVEFTVRSLRRAARVAYGDYIASLIGDLPFWLVTITHGNQNTHPEQSVKVRKRFLNDLNRRVYGSSYDRHGAGFLSAFGIEYQFQRAINYGGRATVHQHGIIGGLELGQLNRQEVQDHLTEMAFGWCRVEEPRNRVASIRYCSKYVSKEADVDLWLPQRVFDSIHAAAL